MRSDAPVLVIGAGICGLATALGLARRGFRVRISERRARPDRLTMERPSINLTLGKRGLAVLAELDLADRAVEAGVRAHTRHIHERSGESRLHPYGRHGEAVLSIRRRDLVRLLLEEALSDDRITIHFDQRTLSLDSDGTAVVRHGTGDDEKIEAYLVVGADGLQSTVRRAICAHTGSAGGEPLETGIRWLELAVPELWPGAIPHAVDVWPRDSIMLIAFPNRDGVKTVLLFVPRGEEFPDHQQLRRLAPELPVTEAGYQASLQRQGGVRVVDCPVWHHGRLVITGDAAHAVTPFLGQGANAALVDAGQLAKLVSECADAEEVGPAFAATRQPEMACLARLAEAHFAELASAMGDRRQSLRSDLRLLLSSYYPGQFQPIYNRVAFSEKDLRVAEAEHEAEKPKVDAVLLAMTELLGEPRGDRV
ncbi:FAD-dependent oxidoreductase [Micromonospora sp. NPDC050397]|uniref:FAD-dependent oxidoreductase n=1 Tax=Micromonospora sp. NPDC050397 TaxID=3364279 RepID=UPI00384ADAAC